MEEKINVAEILKDKPKGTKLYSDICCGECVLNEVSENAIYVDMYNKERFWYFSVYGTIYAFPNGGVLLYPSKEMRDWSKFAWKKGDVLVNKDGDVHIIFERFVDDTYYSFVGKYYLWKENNDTEHFYKNERLLTSDFQKASKDAAQTYISAIEERLGGKLNLQTLEIEKQLEFKDGDIVFMKGIKSELFANCIFILKGEYKDGDERAFYYAFYNADDKFTEAEYGNTKVHYSLRSATDSEKQQLFDALAKEGKSWDAEKKLIVNLKPKCEFKPFDKVLCRNSKDDTWEADFFARLTRKEIDYTQSGKYLCVGDLWMYCIPYNEETAHLLGTTDEWKGGKQ